MTPKALLHDLLALGGVILLVIGAGSAWPPLGWLVAGCFLLAAGILGARYDPR